MATCKHCGSWVAGKSTECYGCRQRLIKDKKFRYDKLFRGKFKQEVTMIHDEKKEHTFGKHLHGDRFRKMQEEVADHTMQKAAKFVKESKKFKTGYQLPSYSQ